MNNIMRFGVSIDSGLLKKFDDIIGRKGYVNRSEAIRDLIRDMLISDSISKPDSEAIGTLTMIYSHDTREMSDKLNDIQHNFYKNIVSSTHIHLDEHNCMEVLIIKGKVNIIQTISDKLLSVKNVKHGKISITATEKILE